MRTENFRLLAVVALAAILTAPACTSGESDTAPTRASSTTAPSTGSSSTTTSAVALTGPATAPADYPGSTIQARLTSVTITPADAAHPGAPGEDTLVTITTEIRNVGTDVLPFPAAKGSVTEVLRHGVNRATATSWAVLTGGRTGLPAQLSPGTTATTQSQFTAPGGVPLEFTFSPNAELIPSWTFTGVEALAGR